MIDPSNPNITDGEDVGGGGAGASDGLDQVGVDCVEQTGQHITCRFEEYVHDHGGNDEAGNGVSDSQRRARLRLRRWRHQWR